MNLRLRPVRMALLMVLCCMLAACHQRETTVRPPEISYGQTECSECGMTVNEDRYAAAMVIEDPATKERSARCFDDIGCLVHYQQKHLGETVVARYVKDYNTRQWLAAEQASYVRGQQVRSPMGYGLLATASRPQAELLLAQFHGAVLNVDEMSRAVGK